MITSAPFDLAIFRVLSFEFPSIIVISRSHLFSLKISVLIESMVVPIPFSSFNVGVRTLIFRLSHAQTGDIKEVVKRVCKKIDEIKRRKKREKREVLVSSASKEYKCYSKCCDQGENFETRYATRFYCYRDWIG